MNRPATMIGFINAGHYIDHYAMLVFAAAVIVMGPALGIGYGELLPYATPAFVAFGAGAPLTGWLGDRWRARAFAVRYFLGFTAAGFSVGLVAWLHETGGFGMMPRAFGGFCLLIVAGALIFPPERRIPAARPAE
jgi:MFS family permease